MESLDIVTNPIVFMNQVEAETPNTDLPDFYIPLMHTYLYYVWRGAFEARRKYIWKKANGDLVLLCLAVYKSFIPAIQLVRLGYSGDALNLIRAIIERVAMLGYLDNHNEQLEKYNNGKTLYKEANKWANTEWKKDETTRNLYHHYGQLSKHVHPNIEGIGGYIVADNNKVGRAFRQYMRPEKDTTLEVSDYYDSSLISLLFALRIADITATKIFKDSNFRPILEDTSCLAYISHEDFENTIKVFQRWIEDGIQLSRNKNLK